MEFQENTQHTVLKEQAEAPKRVRVDTQALRTPLDASHASLASQLLLAPLPRLFALQAKVKALRQSPLAMRTPTMPTPRLPDSPHPPPSAWQALVQAAGRQDQRRWPRGGCEELDGAHGEHPAEVDTHQQ